jgi:hypothetical protein
MNLPNICKSRPVRRLHIEFPEHIPGKRLRRLFYPLREITAVIRRRLTERLQYIAASWHLDLTGTVGKHGQPWNVVIFAQLWRPGEDSAV